MEALTSHRTTQHVVNDMLPWQCEESVLPQGANGCHKGNHPKRNETKSKGTHRHNNDLSHHTHPPCMAKETTRREGTIDQRAVFHVLQGASSLWIVIVLLRWW